jgi:hypothetical protein
VLAGGEAVECCAKRQREASGVVHHDATIRVSAGGVSGARCLLGTTAARGDDG